MGNWIYGYNGYGFTNDAGAYYGPEVSLNVDPSMFSAVDGGGEIVQFDVITNPPELLSQVTARSAYSSWLSVTPSSAGGSFTVDVSVKPNASTSRTGYIDVSANDCTSRLVTVQQDAEKNIVVDFASSTTYLVNSQTVQDGYREVIITGMESGDVLTLYYNHISYEENSYSGRCWVGENSTSSWSLENTDYSSDTTAETHANVSNTDTIYLRSTATVSDGNNDFFSSQIVLTNAILTSGTGNVSVSGTTSFMCSAGIIPH